MESCNGWGGGGGERGEGGYAPVRAKRLEVRDAVAFLIIKLYV